VFYHAQVKLKPERAKESAKFAYETDLSREDLIAKIAAPFLHGKQFFCGGTVIQPSKVEGVKFNQTGQSSKELMPFMTARARAGGSIMRVTPRDVIYEGQDITREVLDEVKDVAETDVLTERKQSDRVFVVHGHDNQAVDQTELLIRRFGLTPIILREAPSSGRTVIEKFEAHADVGFAIILLTPDDVGGVNAEHLNSRARQNVVWEWGYLIARLGRSKVICLYKQGVEMPSDLHGLVTIHVDDDVRNKAEEIRREMNESGYHIP
jgi:predicted nucleotide-binding protein